MVVISDTSVISNLWQVEQLPLLPTLFGELLIPPAVQQELSHMQVSPPFLLEDHPWLKVRALNDYTLAASLELTLDPGESEAIALAKECKANALLIDEAKGRKVAIEYGIPIIGLLGILLAAKKTAAYFSCYPFDGSFDHRRPVSHQSRAIPEDKK